MTAGKRPAMAGRDDRPLTHDELVVLLGDLGDARIAQILATGATARDVDEAIAWAEDGSDEMGKLGKRLSGRAAEIYDILITRKETEPDR